jgi:hypothetical protein
LALLGIGIYCQVADPKVENSINGTATTGKSGIVPTVKPGTAPTVKPGTISTTAIKPNDNENVINQNILEEVKEKCKTVDTCVELIRGTIHNGGLILIIVSAVLVIITVIGMCGASMQNKCLLGIYFAFILILLLAVAIATIYTQTEWLADLKKKAADNDVVPQKTQDKIDGIINFIGDSTLWVLITLMIVLVITYFFNFLVPFRVSLFYVSRGGVINEINHLFEIFISFSSLGPQLGICLFFLQKSQR